MEPVLHIQIEKLNFVSDFDKTSQPYLIMKPENPIPDGIVIYLHGATNHMEQGFNTTIFNGTFSRLQNLLYKKNYIYVCPEYRGDSWMNEAAESDIVQLVNILKKNFKTQKVYIMGGSMGGTSSLIFSTRHPELVSGVLAMCPATDMERLYNDWSKDNYKNLAYGIEIAYGGKPLTRENEYKNRSSIKHIEKLKNKPVAIIHGDKDALISVEHSRLFVKEAKKKNVKIFYYEIKNGDHDSPVKDFAILKTALLKIISESNKKY